MVLQPGNKLQKCQEGCPFNFSPRGDILSYWQRIYSSIISGSISTNIVFEQLCYNGVIANVK